MSRLVIDIPDEQHQKIKALAILSGTTIKQFILDKLLHEIEDGRDLTMQQNLEAIFATRMVGKRKRYPRKQMYQIMRKVIEEHKKINRIVKQCHTK